MNHFYLWWIWSVWLSLGEEQVSQHRDCFTLVPYLCLVWNKAHGLKTRPEQRDNLSQARSWPGGRRSLRGTPGKTGYTARYCFTLEPVPTVWREESKGERGERPLGLHFSNQREKHSLQRMAKTEQLWPYFTLKRKQGHHQKTPRLNLILEPSFFHSLLSQLNGIW